MAAKGVNAVPNKEYLRIQIPSANRAVPTTVLTAISFPFLRCSILTLDPDPAGIG
jgi:hypothetical protein